MPEISQSEGNTIPPIAETLNNKVTRPLEQTPPFTDQFNLNDPTMIDTSILDEEQQRELLRQLKIRKNSHNGNAPYNDGHIVLTTSLESKLNPSPITEQFNLDYPAMIDVDMLDEPQQRELLRQLQIRQNSNDGSVAYDEEHIVLAESLESKLNLRPKETYIPLKDRPTH